MSYRLGERFPLRRNSHVAVCLNYGEEWPQLFVFGGVDTISKTLVDGWILDVQSWKWSKVS